MKKIKIDKVEVSVDQIKKAMKEHPELFKESNMPWRAEKGVRYYFVTEAGYVSTGRHSSDISDLRYSIGNYFKTHAEAWDYMKYLKAIGKVRLAILEANDGWEADWSKEYNQNYYIFYDHHSKRFKSNDLNSDQDVQVFPYIKDGDTADQIIKDHEPELKLIFNVK